VTVLRPCAAASKGFGSVIPGWSDGTERVAATTRNGGTTSPRRTFGALFVEMFSPLNIAVMLESSWQ